MESKLKYRITRPNECTCHSGKFSIFDHRSHTVCIGALTRTRPVALSHSARRLTTADPDRATGAQVCFNVFNGQNLKLDDESTEKAAAE